MPRPSLKARLERLAAEYGSVAIAVYFSLFAVVLGGFAAAIALGVEVEGAAGKASVLGAAWVATKLTQPLRIGATLLLTPLVGGLRNRWRARGGAPVEAPADEGARGPSA